MLRVTFPGHAGTLEGFLHTPDESDTFPGVVVCHPHPLMGGDMHNGVVTGICRALEQVGIAALRFNFRGVGGSQGDYDEGRGEVDDARAALGFLTSHEGTGNHKTGIAGYSFGAGIAMKAALQDERIAALAVVARARVGPDDDLGKKPSLPMLFIVGDNDRLVSRDQLDQFAATPDVPPEMHLIPGADHFFLGREREVGDLVAAFFSRWLKPAAE